MVRPVDAIVSDLNRLIAEAKGAGRGLDALTLVVARDAVEMHEVLMVAIRGHRHDTEHIHTKGVYPRVRFADQRLYEAAGLPRVGDPGPPRRVRSVAPGWEHAGHRKSTTREICVSCNQPWPCRGSDPEAVSP